MVMLREQDTVLPLGSRQYSTGQMYKQTVLKSLGEEWWCYRVLWKH